MKSFGRKDRKLKWFSDAKYGLFIHWGPYSQYGRGEQVLFREHMDQKEYIEKACSWDPAYYNPEIWADTAKKAGMRYAVLTTRHHDGYCLWDTKYTDYSSAAQKPGKDFVAQYAEAFRSAGLRVGLYYSLVDWRLPSYFRGPEKDPAGWKKVRRYIHDQVEELLTNYGKIDIIWFDGLWPRSGQDIGAVELAEKIRALQPGILINERLNRSVNAQKEADGGLGAGREEYGEDFKNCERAIVPSDKPWEACMVSSWRLWGYAAGERWQPADAMLDMLCQCAENGGNLLLNVGPKPDGQLPPEFVERVLRIGDWLKVHGEAVFGPDGGNLTEFVTVGRQTIKKNVLYLIIKFWDGGGSLRLADITTPLKKAVLLTTGQELRFSQKKEEIIIKDLPHEAPSQLFPVIKLTFAGRPEGNQWADERLWSGDPARCVKWAEKGGGTIRVGAERK